MWLDQSSQQIITLKPIKMIKQIEKIATTVLRITGTKLIWIYIFILSTLQNRAPSCKKNYINLKNHESVQCAMKWRRKALWPNQSHNQMDQNYKYNSDKTTKINAVFIHMLCVMYIFFLPMHTHNVIAPINKANNMYSLNTFQLTDIYYK